jgi:TldD protein
MISRPLLDALWTRAARVARHEGAVLDELYIEEARRERAWASSHGPSGSLVELDRGMSIQLLRGELRAFGARAGLDLEGVVPLVRETAARPRARRSPARAHLELGRRAAELGVGLDGKGGLRLSLELLRARRRYFVRHQDLAARTGSEEIDQAEIKAEGERRGRRAQIEVRVPLDASIERAVAEAREGALRALRAKPAPSGKTTVVLGPGSGAALFHEVIGHPLEADFIATGRSWYRSGLVGKKLAIDELSIADDPRAKGSPVQLERDGEGVRARRVVLLEKGELSGLLLDRATARLAGVSPNGHARRSSWRVPARPRMTSTVVAPGPHSADELLASVRSGVYVARMAFGRADFVTGRFCMAASEAFAIRHGKLGAPLANVHLEGDALSLLASVRAVASDLAFEPGALLCDKEDEVWVGLAQPTVLLHGISVG